MKLTRSYSVAETTAKGETSKAVYTGKRVLIEKKGNKYTFSIEGNPLGAKSAPELAKEFSDKKASQPKDEEFLPDGPVKVGGGWQVPAAKSEKMFKMLGEDSMKFDAKKSTITGKLLKAYKKDGVQYGVIELTFTVFVTEMDIGGQFVKTAPVSKMVIKGTVDTCIDGTVDSEDTKLNVTIDIKADIPNGSIVIQSTTTGVEKEKASKK